jgi:hypothetical protein
MLVDPTPRSLRGLVRWRDFWERAAALPSAQIELKADDLCHRQEAELKAFGRAIRQQLAAAREEDDLARELIRVALQVGELIAFASYPTKQTAFRTERFIWDLMASSYHDIYRSIDDGILALDLRSYRPQTIERELVNRPLFIDKAASNRWLRLRPPSAAAQMQEARQLIQTFRQEYPRRLMRRDDFVETLTAQMPGVSKNRAKQLWAACAPCRWQRPGTKAHSGS